jgi:hypothetical protein
MKRFHLPLKASEGTNFLTCASYEINFVNPPITAETLFIQVAPIFSHNYEELDVAFHFPVDKSKFKAVCLPKSSVLAIHLHHEGFIRDELLRNVEQDLSPEQPRTSVKYENVQTAAGFVFLKELIQSNKKVLIEVHWMNQLYMILVDLTVFNYESLQEASFIVPLYHRSQKIINDELGQDLSAFPEPAVKIEKAKTKLKMKKPGKRDSVLSIEVKEEVTELKPLMIDGKPAAVFVKINIPRAINPETLLENLKSKFNEKFPFTEESSLKDQIVSVSEKNFKQAVENMARQLDGQSKDQLEVDKTELKAAMKDMIGNKLNVGKSCCLTNHEFKVIICSC